MTSSYRYTADITSAAGVQLVGMPVEMNWGHALQSAGFAAARQGRVAPLMRYADEAAVSPVWDEGRGEPHVSAFRVDLATDGEPFHYEIPRAYAGTAVELGTGRLVSEGKLEQGELFAYELLGFTGSEPTPHAGSDGPRFSAESVAQPLNLGSDALAAVQSRSDAAPASSAVSECDLGDDMPVFIHASVLEDAQAMARRAGDHEAGGILLGQLYGDTESPEIFVQVSAMIEARHTVSQRERITFTPDTWNAARAAVELRGSGECILGWVHNHPWFCAKCAETQRTKCPYRRPFFSAHDSALHGACFTGAFQVGLLVSDLGDAELSCDLFGWRRGLVVQRGFRVLGKGDGQ